MSERFTFFLYGPFSQWHPSPFMIEGSYYNCVEQFMMAEKARLFGDPEALEGILQAKDPRDHQAIGRRVKGFDQSRWDSAKEGIVQCGNEAKFAQNEHLRQLLLNTAGTRLVEANPNDPIWGIGLPDNHPDARHPKLWRGQNKLGEILTELRDRLIADRSESAA